MSAKATVPSPTQVFNSGIANIRACAEVCQANRELQSDLDQQLFARVASLVAA
jgi:hypothetical protein